jgi:hypothetical protein
MLTCFNFALAPQGFIKRNKLVMVKHRLEATSDKTFRFFGKWLTKSLDKPIAILAQGQS